MCDGTTKILDNSTCNLGRKRLASLQKLYKPCLVTKCCHTRHAYFTFTTFVAVDKSLTVPFASCEPTSNGFNICRSSHRELYDRL